MIASFSVASTAHVTQWSNYLTQRAEILSRRSNLTPQQAKNTVNDLFVVPIGCLIVSSIFLPDHHAAVGSLLPMEVMLANTSLLLNTLRKKQ